MRFLPLIWAGLWYRPLRTAFTLSCIAVAFVLFGLLQGVDAAFTASLNEAKMERLFVDGRLGRQLPLAYKHKIARLPGVVRVVQVGFLPGYFRHPNNTLRAVATEPEVWLAIRPEVTVPAGELERMATTRTGVLINDWLAERNNWKVGDRITIQTGIPTVDGRREWTFDVVGRLANMEKAARGGVMLANFEYYDRQRQSDQGFTNRYLVEVKDAAATVSVSKAIDEMFTNAVVQTRTQSEHEDVQSELANIGDVSFFTDAIVSAVLLALLVVTSNVMIESARERTACFAVLRTLGYRRKTVLALLVSEGLILALGGAGLGLLISVAVFPLLSDYLGTALLPFAVLGLGGGAAIALAVASSLVPAAFIVRMKLVDALAVR